MAKNKNFDNLMPGKKGKNDDDKTMKVIGGLHKEGMKPKRQRLVAFNIKLPEDLYELLNDAAIDSGLTKKAIVVQALRDKLIQE